MALSDNIYIMNDRTWEKWKDGILEQAMQYANPMPYMKFVANLEVLVDNILKDDVIEVYSKELFDRLENEQGEDFFKPKDWYDEEED